MFALAFGQLSTKVFALQWIFAFVIAGILTVWSFIALVVGGVREVSDERAPLLVEVKKLSPNNLTKHLKKDISYAGVSYYVLCSVYFSFRINFCFN